MIYEGIGVGRCIVDDAACPTQIGSFPGAATGALQAVVLVGSSKGFPSTVDMGGRASDRTETS